VLAFPHGYPPRLPEVAEGRGNGTGNLLVVLLRLFLNAAVLRWRAQRKGFQAGEGGDHGEDAGGVVHVQAHCDTALLRRFARKAGLKGAKPEPFRGFRPPMALIVRIEEKAARVGHA